MGEYTFDLHRDDRTRHITVEATDADQAKAEAIAIRDAEHQGWMFAGEGWLWSETRQCWVRMEDGQEAGCIPGDVLPGSEHPRHYSLDELAEMMEE